MECYSRREEAKPKIPGEFRASQNWIGGSRPGNAVYVPPPRDEVVSLMGQIETFYHE
jgi:Fic family protein